MGLYSHYEWRNQATKHMYGRTGLQTYTLVKTQGHIFWTRVGGPLSTLLSTLFQTVGRTLKIILGISVTVFCDLVFGATSPPAWTQASCLVWLKSNLSEGLGITVSNCSSCFWMWSLLRYSISLVPHMGLFRCSWWLWPHWWTHLWPPRREVLVRQSEVPSLPAQHQWSGTTLSSDKEPTFSSLALSGLPGSEKAT